MRPYAKSIIELFDGKKRYLIPLYQRQYAWKVEPQLQLLWEDIERAVARVTADRAEAAPHFMGAIVIAEIKTFDKQVRAYEVIDGQQRLTTFQLLLAALRDTALANGSGYAADVDKLLLNEGMMETPAIERYKLWPTVADRRVFAELIDPAADVSVITTAPADGDGAVRPAIEAYSWFRARIEEHVGQGDSYEEFRLEKLFEALQSGLRAVSIELEGGDDPQTIFETLNSRGVDLSPGDLMRNFIFQRAKGLGQHAGSLTIDDLYTRYWQPLDGWFWRENDTRGRQVRARLDWLLVDHLTMKLADLVSVEKLFETYRRWILSKRPFATVQEELESIDASSRVHQLLAREGDDPLGRFGRFARAFDVSTTMPLVLYLASEAQIGDRLEEALKLIESYLLRRDTCGLTTNNYNRFFSTAIDRLRTSSVDRLMELRRYLSQGQTDISRWPDDGEWRQAWLGRDQYKASRQPRLRYLFEGLEQRKRSALSEAIEIKSGLTIEHIMPQKWRAHWPVPGFDHLAPGDVDLDQMIRETERDQSINKLGNLTLLTHSLNASQSNGAFAAKMPAVRAHASLTLNRELHAFDHWDEATIAQRGASLFETARQIWSGPEKVDGGAQAGPSG